jgi:protein SCO1/2
LNDRRITWSALVVAALLLVTACAQDDEASAPARSASPSPAALTAPHPAPPLLDLVNADGSAFDLASYAGGPTLLFFGYTHCPDVCPATIGEIFGVFDAAPQTKAVFVSVDPERDTPEWLAKWTEYLPESFDAVTGSPGAVRRAADGYGVRYARVETTSTAGYTMSHTADLFLIDGDGQLVRSFPFGTKAADIAAAISGLPSA